MPKSKQPKPQKRMIDPRLVLRAIPGPGIASVGVAGGRMVPVVRVDTQNHPAIEELVRLHDHFPDGDVSSFWGLAKGDNRRVFLSLKFHRPSKTEFAIGFHLPEHSPVVDLALQAKAIYLEPYVAGRKGVENLENPRIMLQLPTSPFESVWTPMYEKALTKTLRESGFGRLEAAHKAKQLIVGWRTGMAGFTFPLDS